MNKILTVKNLEKTYKTDIETLTVLKNLNFEALEGSKTAIVGESGSGKSTLLNIIGSIDTATGGTVQAGTWNLTSLSEREKSEYRSSFLGLVFQFHYLLKDFTALENVFMPAFMAGVPRKTAEEKAQTLCAAAGNAGKKLSPGRIISIIEIPDGGAPYNLRAKSLQNAVAYTEAPADSSAFSPSGQIQVSAQVEMVFALGQAGK